MGKSLSLDIRERVVSLVGAPRRPARFARSGAAATSVSVLFP